jgi:hypothetical protein
MLKFKNKFFPFDYLLEKFRENCAIKRSLKRIGFKNRNFGNPTRAKRQQKPFWDCGGQGCRIISVKVIGGLFTLSGAFYGAMVQRKITGHQ